MEATEAHGCAEFMSGTQGRLGESVLWESTAGCNRRTNRGRLLGRPSPVEGRYLPISSGDRQKARRVHRGMLRVSSLNAIPRHPQNLLSHIMR